MMEISLQKKPPHLFFAAASFAFVIFAACIWSQAAPAFAITEAPAGALRYTVVQGDDLPKIAGQLGISDWTLLATWNNITSPYLIYPGDQLRYLPAYATVNYYTVVQGDDLPKIAGQLGISDWTLLATWNNITSPYLIYPGDQLRYQTSGTARPQGPLVPVSGVLLGAFDPLGISHFEEQVGLKATIENSYYGGLATVGDDLTLVINRPLSAGRIPMVTWDMPGTAPLLNDIIAGKYDDGIRAHADIFKQSGKKIFLRWGAEMNGNWISTYDGGSNGGGASGPANFVAAWRHIHDLFVNEGATNAIWVWTPNAGSVPAGAWNYWKNYYPGDEYVDWVGIDGFNDNWGGNAWQTSYNIFKNVYNDYKDRKPILIAETGSVESPGDDGTRKATWFTDSATSLEHSMPSIAAYVYFNMDRRPHGNFLIGTTEKALEGFRMAFAQNRYFVTMGRS